MLRGRSPAEVRPLIPQRVAVAHQLNVTHVSPEPSLPLPSLVIVKATEGWGWRAFWLLGRRKRSVSSNASLTARLPEGRSRWRVGHEAQAGLMLAVTCPGGDQRQLA
jgi:hypothetical protein